MICPLCNQNGSSFFKNDRLFFYECGTCKGIFADKKLHLNTVKEKERYKHHKNHIDDIGYIQFADPIIATVKKNFKPYHYGLDFGVGHTPVISKILELDNYQLDIYDPLFYNNKEVLKKKYDFIVCCEVIEHFYHPKKEFKLLFHLLKPLGQLICMTYIYNKNMDFKNWFYKNDPTHVFLYQKETLNWIKEKYNFRDVKINKRLIIFSR